MKDKPDKSLVESKTLFGFSMNWLKTNRHGSAAFETMLTSHHHLKFSRNLTEAGRHRKESKSWKLNFFVGSWIHGSKQNARNFVVFRSCQEWVVCRYAQSGQGIEQWTWFWSHLNSSGYELSSDFKRFRIHYLSMCDFHLLMVDSLLNIFSGKFNAHMLE